MGHFKDNYCDQMITKDLKILNWNSLEMDFEELFVSSFLFTPDFQYFALIISEPTRYVLNADEYDDSMFQGPPRNLPRDEVFNLFGESQFIPVEALTSQPSRRL